MLVLLLLFCVASRLYVSRRKDHEWRTSCQENAFLVPIFQLCNVLASALTPLAILSVGLMFKLPHLREIIASLTIVILLKSIIKPLLASSLSAQFGFPEFWREVLVLLAAMPPAVLGAVFLRRYGGDASLSTIYWIFLFFVFGQKI